MEPKASKTNKQIAQVGHEINGVMAVLLAIDAASNTQEKEQQVCCGVHELGSVMRCIVILTKLNTDGYQYDVFLSSLTLAGLDDEPLRTSQWSM